jgi:hypothetical protein
LREQLRKRLLRGIVTLFCALTPERSADSWTYQSVRAENDCPIGDPFCKSTPMITHKGWHSPNTTDMSSSASTPSSLDPQRKVLIDIFLRSWQFGCLGAQESPPAPNPVFIGTSQPSTQMGAVSLF